MDSKQLLWLFFGTSGRVGRAAFFLAGLLVQLLPAFLLYRFTLTGEDSGLGQTIALFFWIALALSVWSSIALGIKRLHDFGQPGIFALALLVPVVSYIVFIVLCFYPGDAGPNRFGTQTNQP